MYNFQVNFEMVILTGVLAGKRYHDHVKFATLSEAKKFAAADGSVIKSCVDNSTYRQEFSQIIDLRKFN